MLYRLASNRRKYIEVAQFTFPMRIRPIYEIEERKIRYAAPY